MILGDTSCVACVREAENPIITYLDFILFLVGLFFFIFTFNGLFCMVNGSFGP